MTVKLASGSLQPVAKGGKYRLAQAAGFNRTAT